MSEDLFEIPSAPSRWSARLSLFAVLLILAALSLHRVFGLATPVAFNVLIVAYAAAALAVALGLYASIGVWRYGKPGAARILVGAGLGLAILVSPAVVIALAKGYPELNDVTTDIADPPHYRALAEVRTGMANPVDYPREAFAELQKKSYPDLEPLLVNRPLAETFDLVVEALNRQHFTVVTEEAPTADDPIGHAEAVDRTLILGFYDDIAVRVKPVDEANSRVDLRSSSRFGRSDFGRNALRLREILREIVARLEATVPAAGTEEQDSPNKKNVKPQKNGGRDGVAARKKQDGAPPSARRAQERKVPPP